MEMHACLIVQGLTRDLSRSTKLINSYGSFGRVDFSRLLFDSIPDPVHYQIVKLGNPDSLVSTGLVDMYAKCGDIDCSCAVFDGNLDRNGLVTACKKLGALHQGKWLHGYLIKCVFELGSYLVTTLLDVYAKCGIIRDARSVFDELCDIDLISWTAMIFGRTQKGCSEEALKLFMHKECAGVLPNDVTVASVFQHELVVWNSIISGLYQNGSAYKALELFRQMRTGSVLPDAVTLVSVLSACASLSALQVGSSFHAYTVKRGLLSSHVYAGTALLTFYANCGNVESARIIFDDMGKKSTVTWSAMICDYEIQGDGRGSLSIFARAGRPEEALGFIQKMPVQPDASLFGAFPHGCGLHSRFDLGEVAIKRMLELQTGEACYIVLMCNLYASDGRWNQVKQVRELMKQRGLMKTSDCSLMEMDGDHFSFSTAASLA
uniref:Pentatricopeptide repeat-containing protein n=1 Tax=Populus trichocarpa TaxID=3694 RepID=A0A2K1ZEF4_POPTR